MDIWDIPFYNGRCSYACEEDEDILESNLKVTNLVTEYAEKENSPKFTVE
jgi:hypothetical protein